MTPNEYDGAIRMIEEKERMIENEKSVPITDKAIVLWSVLNFAAGVLLRSYINDLPYLIAGCIIWVLAISGVLFVIKVIINIQKELHE